MEYQLLAWNAIPLTPVKRRSKLNLFSIGVFDYLIFDINDYEF